MCFGGGGNVEDNSHRVAEIEAAAAREAREAAAQQQQREREEFEQRLAAAYQGAMGSAQDYFSQQGLDPAEFQSFIQNTANQSRASVPQGAADVGSFFDSLGERAYSTATEANRNQALRDIDSFAQQGFARQLLPDSAIVAPKQAILAEQLEAAQRQAQSMAARGVVNEQGLAGILQDLDSQSGRATRQLREIGQGILETGRGDLRNLATEGRSTASNLRLGTNFDPSQIQQGINDRTQSFFDSLGEEFRSFVPRDLFDTSGMSLAAGRAQGVTNTPFDPAALAGIFRDDDDDDKNNQLFSSSAML